jgi:hypothetical protein
VSTLLHATLYVFFHNLLNVLVQIANKMGLQEKIYSLFRRRCNVILICYRRPVIFDFCHIFKGCISGHVCIMVMNSY